MFQKLNEIADEILNHWFNVTRQYTHNYSCLETGISINYNEGSDEMPIFAAQNGGLLTVLQIDGLKTITSEQTYVTSIINRLTSVLDSNFKKPGHYLQMCFQYDPSRSKEMIDAMLADRYKACEKLRLNLHYLIDDEKNALYRSGMAAEERNYMLLWTTPALLSAVEAAAEDKARIEEFKSADLPLGGSANPFVAQKGLINKHKAFVKNLIRELANLKVDFQVLNLRQAAREMRAGIDRNGVSDNWNVRLPGDYYIPTKTHTQLDSDGWRVTPTSVAEQIFKQDIDAVTKKIVRCGNTFFAPVYMNEPPQEVGFFHKLFARLTSYRNMGWRVMFSIGGDGVGATQVKRSLSAVLAFASERNRIFNDTVDSMGEYVSKGGLTAVAFRMSACTWGRTLEEAETNVSQLVQSLESWGSPSISDVTGNPIAGLASASIGFTPTGIGTESAPPLQQAVAMLPLSRPAQIWPKGSQIFSTPDGKLMPYQPMSSLQSSWCSLYTAIPGYGKSVSMNDNNLGFVLNSQNEELPYIAIIDMDRSAEGFVRLIRDALPEEEKDKAQYVRLTNNLRHCINPNDTLEGCRFPLESKRNYILSFILTAMTDPLTGELPADNLTQFLGDLMDRTFQTLSDCYATYPFAKPRPYVANKFPNVTNALAEIGFAPVSEEEINQRMQRLGQNDDFSSAQRATSWWEVSDRLYQHPSGKYTKEAKIAQQQAVPVLSDYILVAREDLHIKTTYGNQLINGEPIIDVFARAMQSLITAYPIVSSYTRFNMENVHILACDLMEVASGSSDLEAQKAALMYMFATNALADNFMLDTKQVANVPVQENVRTNSYTDVNFFKQMFLKKIGNLNNANKRFVMDEMSVPMRLKTMRTFVTNVVLMMRKRNTEFMGATQLFSHYPDDLLAAATTQYILSPCNEDDIQKLKDKAGVTEPGEISTLREGIAPPSAEGGLFVAIFKTKRNNGRYAVWLRNKVGAVKLWSLTTTQEDYRLFNKMEELLNDPVKSRLLLAKAFPSGSAKSEVERLMREMDSRKNVDIYDMICRKTIDVFRHEI